MKDKAERWRLEAEAWKLTAVRLAKQAVLSSKCPDGVGDEECLELHCLECWLVSAFRETVGKSEDLACMRNGELILEFTKRPGGRSRKKVVPAREPSDG